MKVKTVYVCEKCGYESPKWFGRCPSCGEWDTAKEVKISAGGSNPPAVLSRLGERGKSPERVSSGYRALDEVLGGGFVKGQVVLLGGEPGVGKSTLALQLAERISMFGDVVYASGEESLDQISMRSSRLGISSDRIYVSTIQSVDSLMSVLKEKRPVMLVLDSIQTFYTEELGAFPGGVSQIRAIVSKVMEYAKSEGVFVVLIGHITKSGDIAGPKMVEHMVDTVLYFEGERTSGYRTLRVFKNRFGPAGGISVFEMTGRGLKSIEDPVFMDEEILPGNAVTCVLEGGRTMIIQIQALVSKTHSPSPRRNTVGIDYNRLNAIVAVLSKRLKIPLDTHEVYVNVLGGMRLTDPAADLAVATAIFSSFVDSSPGKKIVMGEIGLDGRVRIPFGLRKRLETIEKIGLKSLALPEHVEGFEVSVVGSVSDILKIFQR